MRAMSSRLIWRAAAISCWHCASSSFVSDRVLSSCSTRGSVGLVTGVSPRSVSTWRPRIWPRRPRRASSSVCWRWLAALAFARSARSDAAGGGLEQPAVIAPARRSALLGHDRDLRPRKTCHAQGFDEPLHPASGHPEQIAGRHRTGPAPVQRACDGSAANPGNSFPSAAWGSPHPSCPRGCRNPDAGIRCDDTLPIGNPYTTSLDATALGHPPKPWRHGL